LGSDSASNLPLAITPCRLSLWLELTPSALAEVTGDINIGANADATTTARIESVAAKDLAKHAAAIPGRSLDWVIWSATAQMPGTATIPTSSSAPQKHCAVEASPEFKSLGSFGKAHICAQ